MESKPKVPFWFSCRVMLAVVGFLGTVNLYALRMDMSVAILCMTNHTAVSQLPTENDTSAGTSGDTTANCSLVASKSAVDGEFAWSKETRGIILGVFFWGYLVTQIPAGLLTQRVGAKWIIFGFMIAAAVSTLLTPVAAHWNVGFVGFLRIVCGTGSGVWFPCFHYLWSHWAPPSERSKLVGFTYAGIHIGNAVTLPIAGALCESGWRWPSVFYLFGSLSLLWCIAWAFLGFDGPTKHPRISAAERDYIVNSLKGQVEDSHTSMKIPILPIIKSLPFWATVVVNCAFDWNAYMFLTTVPSYMKDVLKFDLSENSGLSALPYLGLWAGQMVWTVMADKLHMYNVLSVTWIRKLMNSIGMFGPAVVVLILGYLNCNYKYWAVGLLTIGLALNGATFLGCFVNHVDIAPRYAGILFAISNSFASVTGFFAPYMVGAITKRDPIAGWQIVFFISCGIYVFGGLFFLVFASAELQPWAKEQGSSGADVVHETRGIGLEIQVPLIEDSEQRDETAVARKVRT